jgi:hypothetical protein
MASSTSRWRRGSGSSTTKISRFICGLYFIIFQFRKGAPTCSYCDSLWLSVHICLHRSGPCSWTVRRTSAGTQWSDSLVGLGSALEERSQCIVYILKYFLNVCLPLNTINSGQVVKETEQNRSDIKTDRWMISNIMFFLCLLQLPGNWWLPPKVCWHLRTDCQAGSSQKRLKQRDDTRRFDFF